MHFSRFHRFIRLALRLMLLFSRKSFYRKSIAIPFKNPLNVIVFKDKNKEKNLLEIKCYDFSSHFAATKQPLKSILYPLGIPSK